MKNYQKVNVPAGEARVELHDSLNLTGAEVSISNLPAGAGVPRGTCRVARFIESDWCRSIYQQFAGWCRSTFCAFAQAK